MNTSKKKMIAFILKKTLHLLHCIKKLQLYFRLGRAEQVKSEVLNPKSLEHQSVIPTFSQTFSAPGAFASAKFTSCC